LKVWEAYVIQRSDLTSRLNASRARATMAVPRLFKPFHHENSKQIYIESENQRNNPILIAHKEYNILSKGSNVEIEYPDVVLSLGTGLEPTSSQNPGKVSLLSRLAIQGSSKAQKGGAVRENSVPTGRRDIWDQYMNLLPNEAPTSRFIRLDPDFMENLPSSEHAAHAGNIEPIQNLVQKYYANGNQIKRLADQLFATLFYFECTETVVGRGDKQVTVQGKFIHLFKAV
jgi:hypothetical protein